jgi:hypothetical protein
MITVATPILSCALAHDESKLSCQIHAFLSHLAE